MKKSNVLFLLLFFFFSCTDSREKIGEEIYSKIIQFENENGYLPASLNEIGVDEKLEGPIYYSKQSDSTFKIYYNGGLGESIVYEPITRIWK